MTWLWILMILLFPFVAGLMIIYGLVILLFIATLMEAIFRFNKRKKVK